MNRIVAPPTVVVIGAGVAGLTAARLLTNTGNFRVVVLEANPDGPGGRIQTLDVAGCPTELGAAWIYWGEDPKHPLASFCRESNLPMRASDLMNAVPMADGTALATAAANQRTLYQLYKAFDETRDQLQQQPKLSDAPLIPATCAAFPEWKEKLRDPVHESISLRYMEAWTGDRIENISTRFENNNIGDKERHISYKGNDLMLVGGMKSLVQTLISGANLGSPRLDVRCAMPVSSIRLTIEKQQAKLSVATTSNGGPEFLADIVVVAVPLGILKANVISFSPPLPSAMTAAIDRIGFGNYKKAVIVFSEVFWPTESEYFFTQTAPKSFVWMFANLLALSHGKAKGLIAFIVGSQAFDADMMADVEVQAEVLKSLSNCVCTKSARSKCVAANVTRFKTSCWRGNTFIRGSFSYCAVGTPKDDAYNVRKPITNQIFFAGEHTQIPEGQAGSLNGAFLSGQRVAQEIISSRGKSKAKL